MYPTQLLAIASVVGAAAWVVIGSARPRPADAELYVPKAQVCQELEDTLSAVQRAWNPRVATRVFAEARERVTVLRRPLVWWLGRYNPPMLREAIRLAVELEVETAREPLLQVSLHGFPTIRPHAIRAVHELGSWTLDELAPLLSDSDRSVRVAAVGVCDTEDTLPALIACLTDSDRSVRAAVVAALPSRVTTTQRKLLLAMTQGAEGDVRVSCIDALGKTGIDTAVETLLIAEIRHPEADVRTAALRALTRKDFRLLDADPVWSLVVDQNSDPGTRVRALYCLERTGTLSVARLRRERGGVQEPTARYFIARGLITVGDESGVAMLIDLLERDDGVSEMLRGAVRRLLGEVSGLSVEAHADEFRSWSLRAKELHPARLDAVEALLDS